jgi:hypothetical protein
MNPTTDKTETHPPTADAIAFVEALAAILEPIQQFADHLGLQLDDEDRDAVDHILGALADRLDVWGELRRTSLRLPERCVNWQTRLPPGDDGDDATGSGACR